VSETVINVALADGLGHGPMAHEASEAFCDYVRRSMEIGLEQLVRRASDAIARTRGAAAAVVRIDEEAGTLAFAGVGNIELQAISKVPIRPVSTPGIVGRPLRKVVVYRYEIGPGDLLALYSDGISSRFDLKKFKRLEPQQIADGILAQHGKHHDDATVLVIEI
jgi:serine/threonine protein phosphatase PrpC